MSLYPIFVGGVPVFFFNQCPKFAKVEKHGSMSYPTVCRGGGRAAGDGCCDGGGGGCSSGVSVVAVCCPTAHNTPTHAKERSRDTADVGRTARPGRRKREEDKTQRRRNPQGKRRQIHNCRPRFVFAKGIASLVSAGGKFITALVQNNGFAATSGNSANASAVRNVLAKVQ